MRTLFTGPGPAGVTGLSLALAAWLLAGCAAPIGADRVSTRQAYAQVQANALRTGTPSAETVSVLHRYDLDRLAANQPDEAVRRLHQKALATGDRNLLFALAEMSYAAGVRISRSVKPWDPRDARDYYLGSAVYAWLFLFGEGKDAPPGAYERRFRDACDFYNYGLGLALTGRRSTNAVVQLQSARRRLPVGEIELRVKDTAMTARLNAFDPILLADQFRVRGLSVRNREAGLGAPLICVEPFLPELGVRRSVPATVFLRLPGSLSEIAAGNSAGSLELYSAFDITSVSIGAATVPLETDLTTYLAYNLNQATVWALGSMQFLAPAERISSRLILHQPYEPDRIPVVFVHGTFSSPVTWAEMGNTLTADPVFRQRYQLWTFIYGSGNPLVYSIADLRAALTAEVQRLDPHGTNAMLRQMVLIGHSQGGLLVKGTAIDAGDRLWRALSTRRFEDLKMNDAERAELRSMLFLKPLPFVRRVVFIATPHRGSYLAGGFARRWARRLVSVPGALVARGTHVLSLVTGSEAEKFFGRKVPTSLDGMSPKNPGLQAMAEIPVAPTIKAHSIIAVRGGGDYRKGRDGLVSYQSAHVNYVESEFIVRSFHSCLDQPATIEEVRRILHEHSNQLPPGSPGTNPPSGKPTGATDGSNATLSSSFVGKRGRTNRIPSDVRSGSRRMLRGKRTSLRRLVGSWFQRAISRSSRLSMNLVASGVSRITSEIRSGSCRMLRREGGFVAGSWSQCAISRSSRLPMNLVASGVSRITSRSDPAHAGCYGGKGTSLRV